MTATIDNNMGEFGTTSTNRSQRRHASVGALSQYSSVWGWPVPQVDGGQQVTLFGPLYGLGFADLDAEFTQA